MRSLDGTSNVTMELKYTCRYCGKTAILGEHRCRAARRAGRRRNARQHDPDADLRYDYSGDETPPTRSLGPYGTLTALLAAGVATAFLFTIVGPIALLLLLAVPAVTAARRLAQNRTITGGSPYRRLLARCHGDHALAQRLVAAEVRRRPGLGPREAAESAIARLDADRR